MFRRLMDTLLDGGELLRSRNGVYQLASGERSVGEIVRDGRELRLRTDDGRLLEIDRSGLRAGDRVLAVSQGKQAVIAQVVSPSPEPVFGLLVASARSWFVESFDLGLTGRIDLVESPSARPGDVVEVRVTAVSPTGAVGRVVRAVEAPDQAALAAQTCLAAHRVPCDWSFDPGELVIPATVSANARAGRRDLRRMPLVTIDGADARDFDDAVFAEPVRRGGWRLVVAIADVAHYVTSGSVLDRDARERGNSLYLPDRVVPMLPEALSNGICSLLPNQERLAVVCDLRVSAQGRVSRYEFYEAVIHSHARLTYDEVDAFLQGGGAGLAGGAKGTEVAASLKALHKVYQRLRARRDERGALDFDTRETRVVLQDGHPVGVEPIVRNDAHRLIEEAMIAANVAAARYLEKRGQQPVYRVHEKPTVEKLEQLSATLAVVGERLPDAPLTPKALADVCQRAMAKSSWPRWMWETIVLRSLSQARYEPRRLGHFGLALPAYAHFTSPIRRYADLLVLRLIKGEAIPNDELTLAATHISMTERRAEDVERAVAGWLKCALLAPRIGETFGGTVAAVTGFGLFVELDGLFVQGLVHVSKLGRDYYEYVPERMSLVATRSGDRFDLADRVEVVVEDVSVATGRIDLALAGRPAKRRRRVRR